MTIEDIEKAHSREKQIRRLQREIRELKDNVLPSKVRAIEVNGQIQYVTGGGSSLPQSPVESQVRQLLHIEERLAETIQEQAEFWKLVEVIYDDEIRSIIWWRVHELYKWERISRVMYGSHAESTSRMILSRYLESCASCAIITE